MTSTGAAPSLNDYDRRILVGNTVIDMGIVGPTQFPSLDGRGYYMGVIDGTTPYGTIITTEPAADHGSADHSCRPEPPCPRHSDLHHPELDEGVFQHHFKTEGSRIH